MKKILLTIISQLIFNCRSFPSIASFILLLLGMDAFNLNGNFKDTQLQCLAQAESTKNIIAQLELSKDTVPQIVKEVSVRILTDSGSGSGTIIAKDRHKYQVLTNYHVISDRLEGYVTILTSDGESYQGKWLKNTDFDSLDLDLALVEFSSSRSYRIVKIGNSNLASIEDRVYASGFPLWHFNRQGEEIISLEDTREWGLKAFNLTTGEIKMILGKSLDKGYQIGYDNNIVEGMSGGGVFNERGELIAVNGRLKHPFQERQAYVFDDGSLPPNELYAQMEALSWSIPSSKFNDLLQK